MTRPRFLRLLPAVLLVGGAVLIGKANMFMHTAYAQANNNAVPAPAITDQDDQVTSAAQGDVLNAMTRRRKELDAREATLNTQANIIAATEQRVDTKIEQLKTLQAQITTLLGQRDKAQQDQIHALIKTYGPDGMKPAAAAAIFNTLPDDVLIPVAQGMKPDALGQILSKMHPDAAQKLTVKLANKLALPQAIDTAIANAPQKDAAPKG